MLSDFQITLKKVYRTYGVAATEAKRFGIHDDVIKKMGALDVRCLYEIHTIRYLNYLLNISHDFIYIIGSRSIWILGSSIVYWAGKEVVSRQGGRHLGLHNVGFQGFIVGIVPVSSLQYIGPYNKRIWH
jgi:hypothetical protein